MSTVSQISNELLSLIAESKRRNSDIRNASERSLQILKTFQSSSMAEPTFLSHLSQNPDFITPFLLSCSTRNVKFSTISIQSLQKLIQSRSIPISKLDLLLESLNEATHLSNDIQLKVLQILPIFFTNYSELINDTLLAKTLAICSVLQTPGKVPMIANAASATGQQIVLGLFEKMNNGDYNGACEHKVIMDSEKELKVSADSYDAYRVLLDLCLLVEKQKPSFLPYKTMNESLGFELLENVFLNYTAVFLNHVELGYLVRTKVVPLLLRNFSNNNDFGIVVRVSRLLLLLIKNLLDILEVESEVILSFLTHVITEDSNLPKWKSILPLEIFQSILNDFTLVQRIYSIYDYDDEKKNIIEDFFTVCSEIIDGPVAQRLLDISETVGLSTSQTINLQNSLPRVPYLEVLDKSEPPITPETYILVLILNCTNSLSDGIGNVALEKTTKKDNSFLFLTDLPTEHQQDREIVQLQHLIVSNAKGLVSIGAEFLYSSIESELFHSLIRSLQKLCHASGVLCLIKQRDSLLLLFSIATISNVSKSSKQQSKRPSIGETFVDTINATMAAFPASPIQHTKNEAIHPRVINSRHIICFRAFLSLTISLGPNLKKSWRYILITLQWFDYYLNGPADYLPYKDTQQSSTLANSDLRSLKSLVTKYNESTKFYNEQSYNDLIQNIISLSRAATFVNDNDQYQVIEIGDEPVLEGKFQLCQYNLDFFLKKIGEISRINVSRYISNDFKGWNLIIKVLTDSATSQKTIAELRATANSTYSNLLMEVARVGFGNEERPLNDGSDLLEDKIFQSLKEFFAQMLTYSSDQSNFPLIESRMVEEMLKTISELLDRFGGNFKKSWHIILEIINSVFSIPVGDRSKSSVQPKLLKSSFEILQFVLNDFLQSLPIDTLKSLIDILEKFCTQTSQLNLSFTAVSYYWLISDFLRQKASIGSSSSLSNSNIESFDDLLAVITNRDQNFQLIWLYLLHSLVKVSNNQKVEVRNGAVQTFFRIFDSHGPYLNWDKTFDVVIKDLLNIKLSIPSGITVDESKTFKESILIVLKGVTDLYSRFFIGFKKVKYWESLLAFYQRLVELDVILISTTVYISYHQIIRLFKDLDGAIFKVLFGFWSSQQIKYVSTDSDSYQLCLVELISCFNDLIGLFDLPVTDLDAALSLFNNSIRFPFLPGLKQDVKIPTPLQKAVLKAMKALDTDKSGKVLVQNLSSLVLLPFQTRSRILKKLRGKNTEIPSFIAISSELLDLVNDKLLEIGDLKPLIVDGTLWRLMKNLNESITYTIEDEEQAQRASEAHLWKKSSTLFFVIVKRIIDDLNIDVLGEPENYPEVQIWTTIIQFMVSTLPTLNNNEDEEFSITQYQQLKDIVVNHVGDASLDQKNIRFLVLALWESSFLYENDELESFIFSTSKDPNEVSDKLLRLDLDSYSTEKMVPYSQQRFRLICIEDLFNLFQAKDERLAEITLPFLLCRLVLIIKRYSNSQRLANNSPVSTIQHNELLTALSKLLNLLRSLENDKKLNNWKNLLLSVFPLILKNHQFIGKSENMLQLLTEITAEFYKISN